jgi:hypothetical protein
MHTGKELEAHSVEKGRLCCDSDAPQVESARFDWTGCRKVNRRETNRPKTRTYCIIIIIIIINLYTIIKISIYSDTKQSCFQ